jgi:hypothetical protein
MPVEVKGAIALRKALREFAPDLAKETTKEIASFLKPITKKARGYLPSNADVPSGWLKIEGAQGRWAERYYDKSTASRGIGYKTSPSKPNRNGFRSLASLYSRGVQGNFAGAIYETAGRKSGIQGNFTPKLGGKLVGKNQKMKGRALFRAFAEDEGKAEGNVIKAIERAAAKFSARIKYE